MFIKVQWKPFRAANIWPCEADMTPHPTRFRDFRPGPADADADVHDHGNFDRQPGDPLLVPCWLQLAENHSV